MRRIHLIIALTVAALTLIVGALALHRATAGTADEPPVSDCTETETTELYVQHAWTCPDGTRVVTFADDRAKIDYLAIAEHYGQTTVEQGRAWARVRN